MTHGGGCMTRECMTRRGVHTWRRVHDTGEEQWRRAVCHAYFSSTEQGRNWYDVKCEKSSVKRKCSTNDDERSKENVSSGR